MKTKPQIYDSLYPHPIRKAALMAYEDLRRDAVRVGGLWAQAQIARADRIASRFRIRDMIFQWRNAA